MLNATTELFLSEYFLVRAVLGKHLGDSRELFCRIGKIFLIPEAETEELYRLSENEIAKSIETEKDFLQRRRMQKYSLLMGSDVVENAEWEEVAGIKGNAVLTAHGQNLISSADTSRYGVYGSLSSAANGGVVNALRITGLLQIEGILLRKNVKEGIKALSKAADWNDYVSTLALLYYCEDTREYNMARLRLQVANTPFEELYKTAAAVYGEADAYIEEVRLLDKSFSSGVLKRETYDPKYARILNSYALYARDKEKAVFTLNTEQICAINELPLKLSHESIVPASVGSLSKTTLRREAETAAIARALTNSDLRCLSSFRPLLLSCDSKYVLKMYAWAIGRDDTGVHCEIIDVAELSEYDLEPSLNNVFVRSIDEDRDNRFLLFFYGEITERKMEAVKIFLKSTLRARFHLFNPNVTLNLSAVLPICFCDEQNSRWLKHYCDEVKLSDVTQAEFTAAVSDITGRKQRLYGVGAIEFDGEVAEVLKGYDIDTAERAIDSAVRARREKGATIVLTRAIIREHALDNDRPKIGFGGFTNGKDN